MFLTAVIFIVFIAILILSHELGHFLAAKLFRLRVDEFAFGFPPRLISKKVGETRYSLNAIPFGGFVKIHGENPLEEGHRTDDARSYSNQPAWKRSVILVAGIVMNFLIGWLAFSFIFMSGIPHKLYVSDVRPGSPAAEAGIAPGDEIPGFYDVQTFIQFIDENQGEPVLVAGKTVVPRVNPPANEGRLGIALADAYVAPEGFFTALGQGFTRAVQTFWEIILGLGSILAKAFSGGGALESVSGPVGIFKLFGATTAMGFIYLIQLLAVLSLNLAVFNLLPIPALDGGRLFFILIEKVIGRKLNATHEGIANLVGFALLILLAITVTINDVLK